MRIPVTISKLKKLDPYQRLKTTQRVLSRLLQGGYYGGSDTGVPAPSAPGLVHAWLRDLGLLLYTTSSRLSDADSNDSSASTDRRGAAPRWPGGTAPLRFLKETALEIAGRAEMAMETLRDAPDAGLVRLLWDIEQALSLALDLPGDEWNRGPVASVGAAASGDGAYRAIYLDGVRSPYNTGSVFRSVDAFGWSEVLLSPGCPDVGHRRLVRSARGASEWVKSRRMDAVELEALLHAREGGRALPVFALETGGVPGDEFDFPAEGICVVGSEERGVSPELLALCRSSAGVVSLPARGRKASMNLSVATGILLWQWSVSTG